MLNVDSVASFARHKVVRSGRSLGAAISDAVDQAAEQGNSPIDELELEITLQRELGGLGPLQPYLEDPNIEELWINRPGELHYYSDGHHRVSINLSALQIRNLVSRMLAHSGRRVDRLTPFVDAALKDGSRLHVVIPEVTRDNWSINIRKFRTGRITLDRLHQLGSIDKQQLFQLKQAMALGQSILIVGATQAGKTTLMNALLSELKEDERLVSCEDTFELSLEHEDWVAMQVRPQSAEGTREIGLRELVKQSLRMRPSRIAIGEVRGAEALDMLVALNSGIPGLCTIHGNSAKQGLQKLLTLPLLAGENITEGFLRPTIQGAFDLAVFCKRDDQGKRRVEEILEVKSEIL